MNLLAQLFEDLKEGQKARAEVKVGTLRFLISKINNEKIAKGRDLSDEEVLDEISREAKRHKESIDAYEAASRQDLVQKEKSELEILSKYLPDQLSEVELEKIVDEVISQEGASTPADMGKVMAKVMAQTKGRADGGKISGIVKSKLEL